LRRHISGCPPRDATKRCNQAKETCPKIAVAAAIEATATATKNASEQLPNSISLNIFIKPVQGENATTHSTHKQQQQQMYNNTMQKDNFK